MEALHKIGIDFHNVIIYLVNFGVLFFVVGYFITGPLLKMLDQRRKNIEDNLEKAERIKTEFVQEKKDLTEQNERNRTEMEKELATFRQDMEEKRKRQEEMFALKKAKMLEEVRTLLEDEKKGILKAAEKQTLQLMTKVILHILSEKVPRNVIEESVQEAWENFNKQAA